MVDNAMSYVTVSADDISKNTINSKQISSIVVGNARYEIKANELTEELYAEIEKRLRRVIKYKNLS